MGDAARSADSRKILNDLLEAEDLDNEAWLGWAREIRRAHGIPVFSELLKTLTNLRFSETDAEGRWPPLLAHRRALTARLGRDMGIRVSVFDWFVNIDPRLKNPKVLEVAQFEKTEKSAMTDWLTGLYNRGAFRAASLRELRRAQRYRQQLSFIFFDLDDFKEVNDHHGHETGDLVLRETSRLLRQAVRDVDICARYGGEEFAVLLPETGRSGAASVAERVRGAMLKEFDVRSRSGDRLQVTISGGIAVYPEDAEDLGDLLRRADSALYRAKSEGKNRILAEFVERRLAHRVGLLGREVVLTLRREGDARALAGRARDISRTGLGLSVEERFDVGEKIEMSLTGADHGSRLDLSGRVVYLAESSGPTGRPTFDLGVGLERRCFGAAAAAVSALSSVPGPPAPEGNPS